MRRLIKYLFVLTLLFSTIAAGGVWWVERQSRGQIFKSAVNPPVPHPAQVALIPGASVLPNKQPSNTLLGRLRAGIELYNRQIVPKLLLSGDNSSKFYDEVHIMRDYCLRHGVKGEDIFLDHAGLRTYDTMARASGMFGVKTAIVVSQELYLPRALLLARAFGIKAEGFVAEASVFDNTWQARAREYPARLKSLIDLYIAKPVVPQGGAMPVTGDGRQSWSKEKN